MGTTVEIVDRSETIEAMVGQLTLDPAKTAVLTIDMQRGSLDPEVATMPVPDGERQRVLAGAEALVKMARARGLPVIQMITHWHKVELAAQPFEQAMLAAGQSFTAYAQSDFKGHKEIGSRGAELMPQLGPEPTDHIVDSKRRFDSFYGTNLEGLLRTLGVDTLIVSGVNTNTCVQATVFGAYSRDIRMVLVREAVASAYGQDLHELALQNIQRRLGWVLTLDQVAAKLDAGAS